MTETQVNDIINSYSKVRGLKLLDKWPSVRSELPIDEIY